jgi:hypothetical protein
MPKVPDPRYEGDRSCASQRRRERWKQSFVFLSGLPRTAFLIDSSCANEAARGAKADDGDIQTAGWPNEWGQSEIPRGRARLLGPPKA